MNVRKKGGASVDGTEKKEVRSTLGLTGGGGEEKMALVASFLEKT